jgi:hypothetical protein
MAGTMNRFTKVRTNGWNSESSFATGILLR